LGVLFNKNGDSVEEMNNRINKGRNTIRSLFDKSLTKIAKKRLYKTVLRNVTIYGEVAGYVNMKNWNKLLAIKMDYLRGCCRRRKLDRMRNEMIE
jgi:hypothetical protein